MRRLRLLAAFAAVCTTSSCHLLPTQKAKESVVEAPNRQEAENTPSPETQVPAPEITPASDAVASETAIKSPLEPAAVSPSPAGFSPLSPIGDASQGASLPTPAVRAPAADDEDAPAPPPSPPAAEMRGLRSPQLPSNLPMSLEGKLNR